MDVNECIYGCGTCSKCLNGNCGIISRNGMRCINGNGRGVTEDELRAGKVEINCWNCDLDKPGCTMHPINYIDWNGRCIHQR